ncbi:hypothetical protein EC604_01500 [Paenibacillus amylolyticus]|uniref:DUF4760 domain-containing protein n=1 Tax=Paenibacillus amylolyticus TaxID=1451 RepID=A0A5M9WLS6_PAEAM|nr:hypothetical protein [Paenibacillus amylolyticus]KAA8782523.1 hypothetical protein EC604_01500 [Paenibacillus amylolyticus]
MAILKEIIETAYYISGIILVVGVAFGAKQLTLLKKDLNDRNRRAAAEKSIEYLAYFEKEIVSTVSEFGKSFREEVATPADDRYLFNKDFRLTTDTLTKEIYAECIIKQRLQIVTVLNRLEFFSAVIESRITDEELLYVPTSKLFCEFISSNHVFISLLRDSGTPYKNLVSLYLKWSKRMEVEKLKLQVEETQHKIKEQGTDYHSSPPIGM